MSDGIVSDILFDIGETWRTQDKPDIARVFYIQSATMKRKINKACLLYTLSSMADTYLAEDDCSTALAITIAILPWLDWSNMKRRAADCRLRLARIALGQGHKERAIRQLSRAQCLYAEGYDKRGVECCEELCVANGP